MSTGRPRDERKSQAWQQRIQAWRTGDFGVQAYCVIETRFG